jgi:hypothetical protein
MPTKRSLMLKVIDARTADVRKILKEAGINVLSIVEVYKEDLPEEQPQEAAAE